jgi:hypothetical protein
VVSASALEDGRGEDFPMDELTPKDPAEAIALYRAQIVGPLVRGELERGDLRAALLALTQPLLAPQVRVPSREPALPHNAPFAAIFGRGGARRNSHDAVARVVLAPPGGGANVSVAA